MIEIISKQVIFFPIRIFVRHRCYLLDCPNEEVATVAVVVVMCF